MNELMRSGSSKRSGRPSSLAVQILARWPTPTASMMPCEGSQRLLRAKWLNGELTEAEASIMARRDVKEGQGKVPKWPTPDTSAGGSGPSQLQRNQPRLQDAVKWATPQSRDWKEQRLSAAIAMQNEKIGASKSLPRQLSSEHPELIGGQLNPTWVEWLMGWPLGWTDCAVSATVKFQQWYDSHGGL